MSQKRYVRNQNYEVTFRTIKVTKLQNTAHSYKGKKNTLLISSLHFHHSFTQSKMNNFEYFSSFFFCFFYSYYNYNYN